MVSNDFWWSVFQSWYVDSFRHALGTFRCGVPRSHRTALGKSDNTWTTVQFVLTEQLSVFPTSLALTGIMVQPSRLGRREEIRGRDPCNHIDIRLCSWSWWP